MSESKQDFVPGKYPVSVRLMTYNFGPYIDQAMDGILKQETNFPFEVVVGDDFSTDDTLERIRKYGSTDRIQIRILEREKGGEYHQVRKEKGRLFNFSDTVSNCTGEYVALIDGDDYWTDPNKLQKQFDVLESDDSLSFCFHSVEKLTPNGIEGHHVPAAEDGGNRYNVNSLIGKHTYNFIPTSSIMYRQAFLRPPFGRLFDTIRFGDWVILFLLTSKGNGYHIREKLGVYRAQGQGMWLHSDKIDQWLAIIEYYVGVKTLYPEYKKLCDLQIEKLKNKIIERVRSETLSEKSKKGIKRLFR